ncbi:MAG: NYN domain-containing protein [Victivallales bacterium]|nr:NYN domain-containing protein [Victivallales bacterium]
MSSKRCICQEAFDWLIGHFTNQELVQFIQANGARKRALSFGGFQISVSTVRTKTMLSRLALPEFSRPLMECLADKNGPWQPLVRLLPALDEKWLLEHWRNLIEDFDCPKDLAFAFSRLESPELKRLGERLLKVPSLWTKTFNPEDNVSPVPFYKAQLMAAVTSLYHGAIKPQTDGTPSSEQPQDTTTEQVENEGSSSKLQDKLLKEQARRREIQKSFNEFQQKAEEKETKLKTEIASLKQSLQETRESITNRLHEQELQHDAIMRQFVEQHFGNHSELAHKADDFQTSSDALLLSVEQTIEEQKQLDQKHGLKTRLRDQQGKLTAALEKLKAITLDSTVVHPAIRRLIPKVEQQIAELENVIQDETDELPLSHTALQLYLELQNIDVNCPETEQELKRLQEFIESSEQHGLILPEEKKTLFALIQKRHSLHQNLSQLKSSHFLPKSVVAEEILQRDKQVILVMAQFFAVLPTVDIVVDACNVILKDGSHWERIVKSNGFAAASRQFIERCRKKRQFFNSIVLVFDSSVNQLNTVDIDGNLSIIYARHIQEEHNADLVIKEKTAELHGESKKVWVVTDDADLKHSVVDSCDAFVVPEAFTNFIIV